MARLIKSTGTARSVHPKNGKTFSLKELQQYVGGYIELVHLNDGRIMVVNEEGKIRKVQENKVATTWLHKYANNRGYIVGDVLVCNEDEIL